MFGGSHAKVLAHFKELGNFELKVDATADAMLVHPRHRTKSGRMAKVRTFRSRFGKHFRKIGFLDAREVFDGIFFSEGAAYVLPNFSRKPLDQHTLEPPKDPEAEDDAMLEADPFA